MLGPYVTKEGIQQLQDKAKVIYQCPLPKTMKELHRFLGLFNFYRKFVTRVAETLIPLHKLLYNAAPPYQFFSCTEKSLDALKRAKTCQLSQRG